MYRWLQIILCACMIQVASANQELDIATNNNQPQLLEKQSIYLKQQFQTINKQQSTNMGAHELDIYFRKMYKLRPMIVACKIKTKTLLNNINQLLTTKHHIASDIKKYNSSYQNLIADQETLTHANSTCSMLEYYVSNEISMTYNAIRNKNKSSLLEKHTPAWQNATHEKLKFNFFNVMNKYFLIKIFIHYLLLICSIQIFSKIIIKKYNCHKILFSFQFIVACILLVYIWSVLINGAINQLSDLELLNIKLYGNIIVALRIILFFLNNPQLWPSPKQHSNIFKKIQLLATTIYILWVLYLVTTPPNLQIYWGCVFHTILIIIYNLILCGIITKIILVIMPIYNITKIQISYINAFIIISGFSAIVSTLFGYNNLGIYLIPNIVITSFIAVLFRDINVVFRIIYNKINDPNEKSAHTIHNFFHTPIETTLFEFFIFRLNGTIAAITVILFYLIEIWGGSTHVIEQICLSLTHGIIIFNTPIVLPIITRAIDIFCIIFLMSRIASHYAIQTFALHSDSYTQNIIQICVRYLFILIGVTVGLMIIEIHYTGILVTVGALSVGLGLGLQNITKNFVSGIMLAVSKSINIGDLIEINNPSNYIKGTVYRVGIMATQIINAWDKAMTIIPNAEITEQNIINYTQKQKTFIKIDVTIMLQDLSQMDLAKALILQIAAQEKLIIHSKYNGPEVLVEQNRLTLWYSIKNIYQEKTIKSKITEEIIQTFKKKELSICL